MEKQPGSLEGTQEVSSKDKSLDNLVELGKYLTLKVNERRLVLLAGVPRADVSDITLHVMKNPKLWLLVRDYGKPEGQKFVSLWPDEKLKYAWIISGVADNYLEQLGKLLRARTSVSEIKGVSLIFVMPSFKTYKDPNALKANTRALREEIFERSSSFSVSKMKSALSGFKRSFERKLWELTESMKLPFDSIIFNMGPKEEEANVTVKNEGGIS
jgi:hypothetical protein